MRHRERVLGPMMPLLLLLLVLLLLTLLLLYRPRRRAQSARSPQMTDVCMKCVGGWVHVWY